MNEARLRQFGGAGSATDGGRGLQHQDGAAARARVMAAARPLGPEPMTRAS